MSTLYIQYQGKLRFATATAWEEIEPSLSDYAARWFDRWFMAFWPGFVAFTTIYRPGLNDKFKLTQLFLLGFSCLSQRPFIWPDYCPTGIGSAGFPFDLFLLIKR